MAVNPNDLQPERTSPSRVRAIVSGLLIGTFTYGSAQWLHNDVLRRAGVIPDSRATGWAVGLGVSASALAWYLDRGRLIMPNVESNQKTRASFQAHQRSLREQNDLARANYLGVIRLTPRDP